MNVIDRFTDFYQNVNNESLKQLGQIYAEQILFVDPVVEHQGLVALDTYFKNLMENTTSCHCDIQNIVTQKDKHMVTWEMNFTHPKLNSGRNVQVQGVTELRTSEDRIVYHRDYYDMGQMIYEQVPLLKNVVNSLKRRLAQ